ncbi:MAG TPA: DUF1036 domain-containing protein [Rhizomicrobium sp.]|nr:DUF1036 domain-containing protein [Rhizomicrobium sp.]
MRPLIAALLLGLIALPAEAGFKVCNRTARETKVALGFRSDKNWSSRGWWTIAARSCREILPGPLNARYYYLYATDELSGNWDGRNGFCVAASARFEIEGRADCEAHGYDRKGFFEVDTGQAHDYTQMLSE